ncbi:MAG: helix-turn-helix domain-containing protein [Gammaproteobacteria bacterium]
MSIVNVSAQTIHSALRTGYFYRFQTEELAYISSHRELSDGEKLVWLNLSARAKQSETMSFAATQSQIALMVGKETNTVYKILKSLEAKGFLSSNHDALRRVTIFQVQLDAHGVVALEQAPKRGEFRPETKSVYPQQMTFRVGAECSRRRSVHEVHDCGENREGNNPEKSAVKGIEIRSVDNQNPTMKKFRVRPGNFSESDPEKNHTLIKYINNNKNINKHLYHQDSELSTAEPALPMLDASALILQFQSTVKDIQSQDSNLTPLKATFEARKLFSEEQLACIDHHHLTTNPAQEAPQATKAESPKPEAPEIKKPLQSQLVSFQLEGQCYLVEESVKNKALSQLQSLHHNQCIKGEASNKSLLTLTSEVFYYLAKAGSTTDKSISQASRLNMAIHLLLKGDWQTPNGMMKQTIIEREQKWQREKKAQGRYVPVSEWRIQYA